jgi:hypothetical protein
MRRNILTGQKALQPKLACIRRSKDQAPSLRVRNTAGKSTQPQTRRNNQSRKDNADLVNKELWFPWFRIQPVVDERIRLRKTSVQFSDCISHIAIVSRNSWRQLNIATNSIGSSKLLRWHKTRGLSNLLIWQKNSTNSGVWADLQRKAARSIVVVTDHRV